LELSKVLDGNMLCYDEDDRHFYTRQGSLSEDFELAKREALDSLLLSIKLKPDRNTDSNDPSPIVVVEDDPEDTNPTPISAWDGLLTAELLLRPNNDHKLLDLTSHVGRTKMASAIQEMDFLDSHDAFTIAQNLNDFPIGIIPAAPKMSIDEMKSACTRANASFIVTEGDVR
jgi:hypothetical protein